MKASSKILILVALATQITSCGKDKAAANLEKQIRSSENCVTQLLQQTMADDESLGGVEFSSDFDKPMYLQSIKNLEADVGEFNKLDMVAAKWNPEAPAASGQSTAENHIEGDNFRVMAVLLSGEQSGATLNIYLKPQGNSWTVIGMDAETVGAADRSAGGVSQASE